MCIRDRLTVNIVSKRGSLKNGACLGWGTSSCFPNLSAFTSGIYLCLNSKHPSTSKSVSEVSNGTSCVSISRLQHSEHSDLMSMLLQTYFAHSLHCSAEIIPAAAPIYVKSSTTVSEMEMILSKCIQVVALRGTLELVLPKFLHFKKMV